MTDAPSITPTQADELAAENAVLAAAIDIENGNRGGTYWLALAFARHVAAERADVVRLREALRACRRATLHGADEPRQNVREIVDTALAPEKPQ
jgi:hypothetical protein